MGRLEVKTEIANEVTKMTLAGVIDEDADFKRFSVKGVGKLELFLSGVKSINSCGIREWIAWINEAGSAPVVFHECPKVVVDQINMVQGFLPASGKVQSFFVPYFNDESGEEKDVLFLYGKDFSDTAVNPPADVKDSTGQPMEMDIVEAKYFKFINK